MPIDFHAEQQRFSYTTRQADNSWIEAINNLVDVKDTQILDLGCGGGIYSKALVEMGAAHVTCADFSEESLQGARAYCRDCATIDFVRADARDTGLPAAQYDIILARALIHHMQRDELVPSCKEAFRLLKPAGALIIQDRTPEDCLLPGGTTHFRGYFFTRYPQLVEREIARRRESAFVLQALQAAAFQDIKEQTMWETRASYPDVDVLCKELLARTGRSILHELTDEELAGLVGYIRAQLSEQKEIIEKDRWTIWSGIKE